MKRPLCAGICAILFSVGALRAATYYVATNGNDAVAGSLVAPWRTIQKAANTLAPGDTALVRGGVYNEIVTFRASGTAGNFVRFQNYPDEVPIVDGAGLTIPQLAYAAGLFEFTNVSYVVVQGFELRNFKTGSGSYVPAGIDITGAPHDLTFVSNRIHDIANSNATSSANAYGIAVHGTLPQAISNLVFRSNEIYSNILGQSETFSLDGNVTDFEVSGNRVHDNNNIGIGFIGWEKVCSDTNQDYARNGVCRSNMVWNISSASNPTYPANDFSADGIYCDGPSNVVIELNVIHHCDLGVEMASEHKGHATDGCICRDNLIWSNNTTGLSIGGYSTSVGRTLNCTILHNTLYHNDTRQSGTGEIELQYAPATNLFTHNIVYANAQALFVGNQFTQNTNNTFDWNIYFCDGDTNSASWEWKKTSYAGFAAWKSGTTNDTHSLFVDPRFVNAGGMNFHLATNSPAINAGATNFAAAAGETDIDGQARVMGGRTDIGADEFGGMPFSLGIAPVSGQLQLQLIAEPGHDFIWERSATLANWQPFLTNANAAALLQITSAAAAAAGYFRARMAQ